MRIFILRARIAVPIIVARMSSRRWGASRRGGLGASWPLRRKRGVSRSIPILCLEPLGHFFCCFLCCFLFNLIFLGFLSHLVWSSKGFQHTLRRRFFLWQEK